MNIVPIHEPGGVCVLSFDRADSSANVFDRATLEELDMHLAALETQSGLNGVILISAKPKVYIAGADLHELARNPDERALAEIIDLGHRVFTRLSRLPVPSVAAIHGVCLGGGCEMALACDWRVASTDKATKIGLPETQLGILPAWGGSVRLPRLIGLPAALGLILPGRQLAAKPALKMGLVDELAHHEYLLDIARDLVTRGKRPPGKRAMLNRAPFRRLVAAKARREALAKTRGNYPAQPRAIQVCTEALGLPLEEGLALEKEALLDLIRTPECRNLMGIFFLRERAKRLKVQDAEGAGQPVEHVAVIGAGVMGAGIAQWVSAQGLPVLLKDINAEALAKGMHAISQLYEEAVKKHVFTVAEAKAGRDRITPTPAPVPLSDIDLVIEAAVEKLDLKRSIFADLEARSRPDTVLATNTSALSIDAIAEGLAHPDRVVGLHFFNPVHKMQLVEIIRGPRTSPAALDTVLRFATKKLGKLPVLVLDSPGFLVNRVLLPYLIEAVTLFRSGHAALELDELMLDFGMPMGPMRLLDEVGLDIAQHVAEDLERRLPEPIPVGDTLRLMLEKGWLGRKSGQGFYLYPENPDAANPPNLEAVSFQGSRQGHVHDAATLRDRMVLVMVNEAARCLAEGVVAAPEDVDFAMISGTGWAPFRGGPLRYADSLGAAELVRRLEELTKSVAPYFAPCASLREMAAAGETFYP